VLLGWCLPSVESAFHVVAQLANLLAAPIFFGGKVGANAPNVMTECFDSVDGTVDVVTQIGGVRVLDLVFYFFDAFVVSGCKKAGHSGQDDGTKHN
jgi:hypothetical protein